MGVSLYPAIVMEGDLTPDAFGSEIDDICTEIHEACKGFGTDEKRLLKAMGSMTPEIRTKVQIRYKQLFEKELKDTVKSECGNRDFGTALQLLSVSPVETDCMLIHMACKGLGTNERLLSTIVCGRTNEEMELLKKTYFDLYDNDLGRTLDSELGGDLETLVFNVLQASEETYDEEYHTTDKMEQDCETLYNAGQGKLGTNEAGLFKILCASPTEYLKPLNLMYAEKYGYTLPKMLEEEIRGKAGEAATFMLGMKLKPIDTITDMIDKACKGFGTDELLLTSILIRYQPLMNDVQAKHIELYGKELPERIKSETRGDYESLLLEVLGAGILSDS